MLQIFVINLNYCINLIIKILRYPLSNFFSDNEINLLKKAKEKKNYIHLKNKSDKNRDVMNVKDLNNLLSMHNIWDQNNFNMVIDKKPINYNKFSTQGN